MEIGPKFVRNRFPCGFHFLDCFLAGEEKATPHLWRIYCPFREEFRFSNHFLKEA
jgi:hypothetical protein